ncbi:MAG: folate family ECF transporter S component [Spirochaetaceae bacterium]|jgi:ECF transporter S component (folate family)|nr:folate family ECF transporter S component [Spirochaetaceae bacterium]
MSKVKKIVLSGLLLAVLIVLERVIAFETQFLRFSFAYVPLMLSAIMLGPAWSTGIAVLGDVIGMLMFPKSAFFPGFTLNALLTGLIYGLFLYNTKNDKQFLLRLILGTLTVLIVVHLLLTSLWLSIMYKSAFIALLSARVLIAAILLPIEVGTMFFLKKFLDPLVTKFMAPEEGTERPLVPDSEANNREEHYDTSV